MRRRIAAVSMLAALGLATAFGPTSSGLLLHQLDAPAPDAGESLDPASGLPPPGDAASPSLPGAPAPPPPSASLPGDTAPEPGLPSAPGAGGPGAAPPAPWAPAPVTGLPLAPAPNLVEHVAGTLAAALVAEAGNPHDALLAATGSASGLGLSGGLGDAVDWRGAAPGTPLGVLAAAEALVAGDFDVREDLQRPLLEAVKAQGLQPKRAVAQARDLTPGAMERAILRLYDATGVKPTLEQRAQLHQDVAGLDPQLVAGLAVILAALADAQEAAAKALRGLTPDEYQLLWECTRPTDDPWGLPCADPLRAAAVAQGRLDRAGMAEAALGVLAAVEQAKPMLDAFASSRLAAASLGDADEPQAHGDRSEAEDDVDIFADPSRLIQVGGWGNDVYYGNLLVSPNEAVGTDSATQILTLDFSGDDLYLARAGGTSPRPVEAQSSQERPPVPVDPTALIGHQDYQYSLGNLVSLTIDQSGNDYYSGGVNFQGAGRMGVGILLELAGDDQYAAQSSSQAAGDAGLGLLYDAAGDDTYTSQYRSQGYGTVGGLGLLLDQAGHDRFNAVLLSQGAGQNQGEGMLLNVDGNDAYSAVSGGITASQGASNLIGLGLLADGAGMDAYTSSRVAQGAINPMAAPYGAGAALFLDRNGVDTYSSPDPGRGNGLTWSSGSVGYGVDRNLG